MILLNKKKGVGMTNKEAIEHNKNLRMYMKLSDRNQPCKFLEENYIALDMAIKALEQQPCEDWHDVQSDEMTLEQARQAVKDLRKKLADHLEQEPCEDAISRKEAIDEVKRIKISLGGKDIFQNESKESIVKILDDLPSVTPQPKVGHWIENAPEYQNIDPPYICSECGNLHLRKTNYCDQCGCRMVEQQESEEA